MPKKQFAFEKGGSKRLKLSWGAYSKNLKIELDGEYLAACRGRELKAGKEFPLPDGSRLSVRMTKMSGLDVRRNGKPVPGSGSDPATVLKVASGIIFFIGGGNLLVGALAFFIEQLAEVVGGEIGGWLTLLLGMVFLVLGFFVRGRSAVALGLAVALTGLLILGLLAGFPRGIAGIVIAVLFLYQMSKSPALGFCWTLD